MKDLDNILKTAYNNFIKYINEYYQHYESLLPEYHYLNQKIYNLSILKCVQKYKIKENKSIYDKLANYGEYFRNIIETLDFKKNSFIKFQYKTFNTINTNDTSVTFSKRSELKDKMFERIIENVKHIDIYM